jgi:hypothetical protein
MKILDTVKKCSDFFNIDCEIKEISFLDWRKIPRQKMRGVYIIVHNNTDIVYIGKGNIRTRQDMHYQKTIGNKNIYMPEGWKTLLENSNYPTEFWKTYYIPLQKETELSAMEGALIHFLQPIANDEVWKDRNK